MLGVVSQPWSEVSATIVVTNTEIRSNSTSHVPELISLVLFGLGLIGLSIIWLRSFRE